MRQLRFILAGLIFLLALGTASIGTAENSPQPRYYFNADAAAGQTLSYTMVTTGSVVVNDDSGVPQTVAFQLETGIKIKFGLPDSAGGVPFTLRFTYADSQGLDEQVDTALTADGISGKVDALGVVSEVETPEVLAQLGLDMTDILIGLVVPRPDGKSDNSTTWEAEYARGNLGPERARTIALTATYSYQGVKAWGGRSLPAVTGRLRGSATMRQGSFSSDIQEIGHALFYVDSATGLTDMSSVSIVTIIDAAAPNGKGAITTKITVTTTLERDDEATPTPKTSTMNHGQTGASTSEPVKTQPDESQSSEPMSSEAKSSQAKSSEAAQVKPGETHSRGANSSSEGQTTGGEPGQSNSMLPDAEGSHLYRDPAGRFEIALPDGWPTTPTHLSMRGTTFKRPDAGDALYVYVVPLPSPAATALTVAKSAVTTYQETYDQFKLIEEPQADTLDGKTAFRSFYQYSGDDGATMSEWALFTRSGRRGVYLQYAVVGESESSPVPDQLFRLKQGFRFGPTPGGLVPVASLKQSLKEYKDPDGSYTLLVPALWPRVERADDGSSVTFAEIGGNGYLTLFSRRGASGLTAEQIVSAWKEEWSKEKGFELIRDIHPSTLAGEPGVRLTYRWSGEGGVTWSRRLDATVVDDTLYAIALDYVADEFQPRSEIFAQIAGSLTLFPPAPADQMRKTAEEPPAGQNTDEAQPEAGSEKPPETPPGSESHPSVKGATTSGQAKTEQRPFKEPDSADSILLLGRLKMRYHDGDGKLVEEWGDNLTVYVIANGEEFVGTTDGEGYLYAANLPPLTEAKLYSVTRIEGRMLGFDQSVAVTFENLEAGVSAPRVASLGTVTVTLGVDRSLTVDVDKSPGPGKEGLRHFVLKYADSEWLPFVKEALQQDDL